MPGVLRRIESQPISTSGEVGPPLSIAYVSPGWPPSEFHNGIVTAIGTLAPPLRARGHRVTILSNPVVGGRGEDESIYDVAESWRSRTLARRMIDGIGYRIAPRWALERAGRRALIETLRRAQAERGIEIVEMEESFGTAQAVCERTSLLVTVRVHGPWFINGATVGEPEDEAFRARVRAEGRAIRAAHAITAPSRDVLDRTRAYYGLPLPDAEVIPGTVPAVPPGRRWQPEACDPKAILFVGRFDRHKGGDLIIEAFGRVLRAVPDARLWYVGPDIGLRDDDGRTWKIEDFIRDRVPGALESGRIRWLGFQPRDELDRLRRTALATVVCSRYETFSSATIESMSMGCPTIGARVGGIAEIIEDGVDGLFHRPGDVDDLAAKIVALLEEPGRSAELGRRALATFDRRFHPERLADRWVDFYRRAIRRGRPR
jgi:glycosyltransferase involved in cell wall biosynthesis